MGQTHPDLQYIEQALGILDLFYNNHQFVERCNSLRKTCGIEEESRPPKVPESVDEACELMTLVEEYIPLWWKNIFRNKQDWRAENFGKWDEKVAAFCYEFGIWYPVWKSAIGMFLIINVLIPPTGRNYRMLVESRLESDPWKKYYPYRAIIELTDSTTMPQLKGVKASVITDLQKRSYGGRRLTRKNFGIRLGDLERAVLRSKG